MKYNDVPLHDNIKKWNVKLLEVIFDEKSGLKA